jgi:uncharacterized protein
MTEIKEITEDLEKAEATMSIVLTNDCNLRCKQCSKKKNFDQKTCKKTPGRMTKKIAIKAIKKFWEIFDLEHSNIKRSILVIGGEPLTNQKVLIELARYVRTLDKKNGIKTGIFVLTNGTLVTKKIAKIAKYYETVFAVSVDGSKKSHDKYRKDIYGKGSYDRAIRGLEVLSKEGAEPLISTVITDHSIKDAKSIMFLAKKYGIKDTMIKPLLGDTVSFLEKSISIEQYAKKAVRSAIQYLKEAEKIGIKKYPICAKTESFVQGCFVSGNPNIECSCAMYKKQIAVWTDGTISLCEKMKDITIGNTETATEKLIKNKNNLVEKLKQRLPAFNEKCGECGEFRNMCSGGCAFSARCITGDLMEKDPLSCLYSKPLYEHLARINK